MVALDHVQGTLVLGAHEGLLRSRLFDAGAVRSENYTEQGECELTIDMERVAFEQLCAETGLVLERINEVNPDAQASAAVAQASA